MTGTGDLESLVVAIWLLAWCIKGANNLISGRRSLVAYPIILHFVLFGIPLWLDITIGRPTYAGYSGFEYAYLDARTNQLYLAFIALLPPIWWVTRKRAQETRIEERDRVRAVPRTPNIRWTPLLELLAHLVMLSPVTLLAFAPRPEVYRSYGGAVFDTLNPQETLFHEILEHAALTSIFCAVSILIFSRRRNFDRWYLFLVLGADAWLIGKRAVVIAPIVMFLLNRLQDNSIRGKRAIAHVLLCALFCIAFSCAYQLCLRPTYREKLIDQYQDFRNDFGRDHTIRTSLFALVNGDSIIPRRLESILFYVTYFVPRSLWPEKPQAYTTYFTCYVFRLPTRNLGFGLTTTILSEAIDNCGWLGLAIGPLIIIVMCRIAENARLRPTKVFAVMVTNALLVLQLSAFLPMGVIFAGLLVFERKMWRTNRLRRVKGRMQVQPAHRSPTFVNSAPVNAV